MVQGASKTSVDPLWYKDAVIYELHVKTFCDSDGDGIGDFRGLIGKLDYLQELGITAIWLLPFYPSPLRDDGYDIADYFDVNPNYGTLDDFRALLDAAHERNLRVITELVINHTSDQNPWFQKSRRAVAVTGVGDPGRARATSERTDIGSTRSRTYTSAKIPTVKIYPRRTNICASCVLTSMRNSRIACYLRKPTSGRRTRRLILAKATNPT